MDSATFVVFLEILSPAFHRCQPEWPQTKSHSVECMHRAIKQMREYSVWLYSSFWIYFRNFYRFPLEELKLLVSGMFFQSCPNYKCSPQKCKIFNQSQDCWNIKTFFYLPLFLSIWSETDMILLLPLFHWQTRLKVVTIKQFFRHTNSALWGLILTVSLPHLCDSSYLHWHFCALASRQTTPS